MLARVLAVWLALWPALVFAQSAVLNGFPPGTFVSRAALDASVALPGPPTFTFQNVAAPSAGSASPTWGPATVSSLSANSLVCFMAEFDNSVGATPELSATINGVSASYSSFGQSTVSGRNFFLSCANVTTGTSVTLTVNYTSTVFNASGAGVYTADKTQFVSTTPTVVPITEGTTGTTITSSPNFSMPAGGAILAEGTAFGGTSSGTGFTTPNTPPLTNDSSFGPVFFGSKSNASANAASQITFGWTGTLTGADIGGWVFR